MSKAESISLESVMKKTIGIKKTLAIWQRSRIRTKPARNDMFLGNILHKGRKPCRKRQKHSVIAKYLTTPHEGTLKMINAGLMALGIVGVVFGGLSFFRGLESDLSIGSLVCVTGATIAVIGLGGRFLASQ